MNKVEFAQMIDTLKKEFENIQEFKQEEGDVRIKVTPQLLSDLVESITEEIRDLGGDIIDDYSLSMSYDRSVEIESVDIDARNVRKSVAQVLSHYFYTETTK